MEHFYAKESIRPSRKRKALEFLKVNTLDSDVLEDNVEVFWKSNIGQMAVAL